ncbi:unnamed protein product [Timema podura]|uniref:Protein DP71L n=1 Tax=Timema podura TaxID=61482 RepID=A0ABN7NUU1_TIMPD|nr:unnamed protein product [Timema podura]
MLQQSGSDAKTEVSFAVGDSLTTIHLMIAWDYAYRAARIGPWEQIARDRTRFQARISQMEDILKPVLSIKYRDSCAKRLSFNL